MWTKKLSMPAGITVETDSGRFFREFENPTQVEDISVHLKDTAEGLSVSVTAETSSVRRVILHWKETLPRDGSVLGGAWERGYGNLEWRHYVPERILPWYFFVQSGSQTLAYGVRVRPGAMCFWTVESSGYSLYMDTRCGGMGVLLNGRTLHAADIRAAVYEDTDGLDAQHAFFRCLCSDAVLPDQPVYGANNWYHAYGRATAEDVLCEAGVLAELTAGFENRPWFIIDDCWQVAREGSYNGGPWRQGNAGFPDMPGLAEKIRSLHVQPGIWMRPLLNKDEAIPDAWRLKRDPQYLDPSVPEVLRYVAEDVRTLSNWGYKLIKHDFTTYDILGRWGFDMHYDWTEPGWRFADTHHTTAEIIVSLYKCIFEAAGDAMILGCNCIGHLGAGWMQMNRTGDDTSGRIWARTRRMGINTLGFTIAQDGAFYGVDADCVALTKDVDEALSLRWLELVARSGTALFVSAPASHLNGSLRAALTEAYRIASVPRQTARPLDWHWTTCPAQWAFADGEKCFDWSEPCGIRAESC